MSGYSILAPIPAVHFSDAMQVLESKDFVAFGSAAFDFFQKAEPGSKVLFYVSHDVADPVVNYVGIYLGIEGSPTEMRRLEQEGYRPSTTRGEKWGFYWKVSNIEKLPTPILLSEIQLASGGYLKAYPRGPLHVLT